MSFDIRKDKNKIKRINRGNCLQESIFMFNKKFYKQKDVVSMSNKLGPIISDIFINEFEAKHMPEIIKLSVFYWIRFVDDTYFEL